MSIIIIPWGAHLGKTERRVCNIYSEKDLWWLSRLQYIKIQFIFFTLPTERYKKMKSSYRNMEVAFVFLPEGRITTINTLEALVVHAYPILSYVFTFPELQPCGLKFL